MLPYPTEPTPNRLFQTRENLRGKPLSPPAFVDQQVAQVVIDFRRVPELLDFFEHPVVVLLKVDRIVFAQAFKQRVFHGCIPKDKGESLARQHPSPALQAATIDNQAPAGHADRI